MSRKKVTLTVLKKKYRANQPLAMITAYDYPSAILAEKANVEMILVGDSLGMVVHGFETTVPVSLEMIILHAAAVSRAKSAAFVIGDMPFGSYEISPQEATRAAVRLMKEGGVDAVKIEGGAEMADTVRAIVRAGIPVMGHIGLTPQSVAKLGGFRVQGKSAESARHLLEDGLALQEAGCFSIVIEAVPARIATAITQQLDIPTIGIGAGVGCSGQVLVWHDMLGLFARFQPKFSKHFADAGSLIVKGLSAYVDAVHQRAFPTPAHTFTIKDDEWESFKHGLAGENQEGEEMGLYGGHESAKE